MSSINERAMAWVMGRDTGTSSKTIWAVMQGAPTRDASTPWDADDFGRCYRLLKEIPEWRPRLPEVAARYPAWTGLVREWDRLSAMFELVVAGGGWNKAASSALYEAMQPLLDEGRIADGWTQTGPGSWTKGPARSTSIGNMTFSVR
jgi:hypothetical protein